MTHSIADCHAHLIDPARYPLRGAKGYKPKADEVGSCEQFCDVLDQNGVTCALLVQLSGYGTDNSIVLDAMKARPGRFKTIAVVEPDISETELAELDEAGVVGLRFNLVSYDPNQLWHPDTKRLLAIMKELGVVRAGLCPRLAVGDGDRRPARQRCARFGRPFRHLRTGEHRRSGVCEGLCAGSGWHCRDQVVGAVPDLEAAPHLWGSRAPLSKCCSIRLVTRTR